MLVIDTSGLLCLLDSGEQDHKRVAALVKEAPGPLLTIDFVLAETDYLVLKRLGAGAERAFLAQVIAGAVHREPVTSADLRRALALTQRHADQELGLTDAALLAVCERLDARRVLTLDRRHFLPYRDRRGRPLEVVPD